MTQVPDEEAVSAEQPPSTAVTAPAEGIPDVVMDDAALAAAIETLAAGHGPLAIDTERAQGFRYTAKAYLIQLRRAGAGTILIDPVALERGRERADLSDLADALADTEWILHAATQDLPCLAELELLPRRLFDTELAGRLLGLPRVSLGALCELALGKTLAKEHSAADWSRRPLPDDWLSYAALDVELLCDLRDWVAARLEEAGKSEWARQEFDYLVDHAGDPPARREDPWRRTSGVHDLKMPAQLAIVRELWQVRDDIARRSDRAPGRVLPDLAITELAGRLRPGGPWPTRDDLRAVRGFGWRIAARYESSFLAGVERAAALPSSEWPRLRLAAEGPPVPRTWASRYPEAFERWNRLRPATVELAEQLGLPVENLLSPDALRRLAWEPPADASAEGLSAFLAERQARAWQRDLVVPVLVPLLAD